MLEKLWKSTSKNLTKIAMLAFDNPKSTLAAIITLSCVAWSQIPKLKYDLSETAFVGSSAAKENYEEFRNLFGADDYSIILVEPKNLFSKKALVNIKQLHEKLAKEVPNMGEVESLANHEEVVSSESQLSSYKLLERIPNTPAELAKFKNHVLTSRSLKNLLIAADLSSAIILVKPSPKTKVPSTEDLLTELAGTATSNTDKDDVPQSQLKKEFVEGVETVLQKMRSKDFKLTFVGTHVLSNTYLNSVLTNMPRFMLGTILCVCFLLWAVFRRLSGVVYPLFIVNMSTSATFGAMALFGSEVTLVTQILGSFILAVGIGDSVHILTSFYKAYDEGTDRKLAIQKAYEHSSLSIMLTSMTTAFGLLSFCTAEAPPLVSLGIFAATGVTLAFLYTLLVLPCLIALTPIKRRPSKKTSTVTLDRYLLGIAKLSLTHPWKIVGITAVLTMVAAIQISDLRFSQDTGEWFPDNSAYLKDTIHVGEVVKGGVNIEVMIDTGAQNGVLSVNFLHRLEKFIADIPQITQGTAVEVARTLSILDIVKSVNTAMVGQSSDHYRIPNTDRVLRQELLAFESSIADRLYKYTDRDFQKARMSVRLSWQDQNTMDDITERIEKLLASHFSQEESYVTGTITLLSTIMSSLMKTMLSSYAIAGLVITILMILIFNSLSVGLITMVPNFVPIIFGLGYMAIRDIPLDMTTITVAAICVGLVVDDTIHLFQSFNRSYHKKRTLEAAVYGTMKTTAVALTFSTLTLMAGFSVLVASDMNNIRWFGEVATVVIFSALLVDLSVSPALLVIRGRWLDKKKFRGDRDNTTA